MDESSAQFASLWCKSMLRRNKFRYLTLLFRLEETISTSSTELFWINNFHDGNLAIMAAPRPADSLEDTILGWRSEGIDVVVSLLEPIEPPGLTEAETQLCQEFGIE